MSVARTAARRRRQAVNNQSQLSKKQRPYYKKLDNETAAKKLARLIATERRIKQGKR